MTAASAPAASRPLPAARRPGLAAGRLLRLELRRNAMLWMAPVAAGLFWYDAYRNSMAMPPLWNMRAMTMQHGALLDFVPPVVGAAAWMGSRDGRRHTTDLVTITPRPRWARQLATWAATTCWAMLAYLICVGALYAMIARQAAWGGPLWWPATVGAAGIPALSAFGFAAGAFFPSRLTAPLVSVAAFFVLGFSDPLAHGGRSLWQVSPIIAGAVDVGPSAGVGTFYHYLPDLSIAQVLLVVGLAVATLGVLGLPAGSGGRWLRRSAATTTAAGLLAAGTAVALVGTARMDPHGMVIIPALHDAANDRPISYTPVCSQTAVPVCLNPAYGAYLPLVTAALRSVLGEVADLPGAPARIVQIAPTYQQQPGNGMGVGSQAGPGGGSLPLGSGPAASGPAASGPAASGAPASGALVIPTLLASPLPGEFVNGAPVTAAQFADQVRSDVAPNIVASVTFPSQVPVAHNGTGPGFQAQQAVAAAMLKDAGLRLSGTGPVSPAAAARGSGNAAPEPLPGTPVYAAAQRFAALPAAVRHAWLVAHLAALRAGRITLAQLP